MLARVILVLCLIGSSVARRRPWPVGGRHRPWPYYATTTAAAANAVTTTAASGAAASNPCANSGWGTTTYPLQSAAIESLGLTDAEIAKRVLSLYALNKTCPGRPAPPSCQVSASNVCDDGNKRVKPFYLSTQVTLNYQPYTLVVTNSIPDHCYQIDAQHANPNVACEHYHALLLPYSPVKANASYDTPMGATGIAVSGGLLYNHKSAEATCNAAAITEAPTFDSCHGHADRSCSYHYHETPVCIPVSVDHMLFRGCYLTSW